MPTAGFHSEWLSIKDHRVLLECRSGFPNPQMRFETRLAVEIVKNNSREAKLVRFFYDDKSNCTNVTIASFSREDQVLERILEGVFHTIFPGRIVYCDVVFVDPGTKQSDHANLTEHLSVEAGVAALPRRDPHGNERPSLDLDGLR